MSEIRIVTTAAEPGHAERAGTVFREGWPEFVFHDETSATHLDRVESYFPEYSILVLAGEEVVAGGWGVPIRWDGTAAALPDGYDGSLVSAVTGYERGVRPDTLGIMAAVVRADRQRQGLAGRLLTALGDRATAQGLERVIAPVRPTLKSRYPLTSMIDFARWSRGDGLHLDPWIRTHQRLGATIVAPAARSMIITGSVRDWEDWTEMAFPQTGSYVVPGALDLVEIDREQDRGRYVETNLWMRHR